MLEAIPEADLLARADPEDTDGDGISGCASASSGWSVRTGKHSWHSSARSDCAGTPSTSWLPSCCDPCGCIVSSQAATPDSIQVSRGTRAAAHNGGARQ
ncbi:hypothetical protein [Archangium sp.]|uniref:hypothetical protein n=1 Tax=Archangium sp. TaxID=1872627 RepID=UPI002D52A5AC|nr:hypothetical protein [Archangium sp.]HYO58666.1 hypothetical protein [Archangium sp.]